MKPLKTTLLALIATSLFSHAADFRIWTSLKGTSIEAQFVSYENGEVKLTTKAPKEIKLKASTLSIADRQYLIEVAGAKGDLIFKGDPSVPEHVYKKPKDFIKKLEQTMSFDGSSDAVFTLWETEHYLLGVTRGVKPHGLAETAEACWHGMASQHYEFRKNWGTTKKLILIPNDKALYQAIGTYQVVALNKAGHADHANNVKATWDRVGAPSIITPEKEKEEFKLKSNAIVFQVKDKKDFRKDFNSYQTHVICGDLFVLQSDGVTKVEGQGYFALSTGHSYYKEIKLTKKTETHLLSKEYADDISSKSGFKDGTSWAKTLQKLVKKGEVKPDLVRILNIKDASELDPEKLVTMYSLSYYIQSSQKRIANYATLVRLVNSSNEIPEPAEFAKIFGFESVEAFQNDWIEFIKSRSFK